MQINRLIDESYMNEDEFRKYFTDRSFTIPENARRFSVQTEQGQIILLRHFLSNGSRYKVEVEHNTILAFTKYFKSHPNRFESVVLNYAYEKVLDKDRSEEVIRERFHEVSLKHKLEFLVKYEIFSSESLVYLRDRNVTDLIKMVNP